MDSRDGRSARDAGTYPRWRLRCSLGRWRPDRDPGL